MQYSNYSCSKGCSAGDCNLLLKSGAPTRLNLAEPLLVDVAAATGVDRPTWKVLQACRKMVGSLPENSSQAKRKKKTTRIASSCIQKTVP
eukprot:1961101-Amphidinium_carterae.1